MGYQIYGHNIIFNYLLRFFYFHCHVNDFVQTHIFQHLVSAMNGEINKTVSKIFNRKHLLWRTLVQSEIIIFTYKVNTDQFKLAGKQIECKYCQ